MKFCAVFLFLALNAFAQKLPPGVVVKGDHFISESDGAEMIYVPAGEFTRGLVPGSFPGKEGGLMDTGVKPAGGGDFSASHFRVAGKEFFQDMPAAAQVFVKGFFIDKYEVSNQRYKKFMDATKHGAPELAPAFRNQWYEAFIWRRNTWPAIRNPAYDGADYPVVSISWSEATAYAKWAGKSLPTELQWEKAARGTNSWAFPWGDAWDPDNANTVERGDRATRACGGTAEDKSGYGVMDLAGNVSEWTADAWPDAPTLHVIKGGNWGYLGFIQSRGWARRSNAAESIVEPGTVQQSVTVGFRCVIPEP